MIIKPEERARFEQFLRENCYIIDNHHSGCYNIAYHPNIDLEHDTEASLKQCDTGEDFVTEAEVLHFPDQREQEDRGAE